MRDRVATCSEPIPRSHAMRRSRPGFCGLLISALLAACSGPPRELRGEYETEMPLSGGAPAELQRDLEPGTWLLEIQERGINARVHVEAAGTTTELLDATSRHGSHYQVLHLATGGPLRVVVRSDDHPATLGNIRARLLTFRGTGTAPSALESGYRAWSVAGSEGALATAESWARAADKLHEAVLQFESAGDDAARGAAAYALANLQHEKRNDWSAAIRAAEIASEAFADADDEQGEHNAAIVRGAAELDLAAELNSAAQRAEQKSLYELADRRLASAEAFFIATGHAARAAHAVNLRGVREFRLGRNAAAAEHFTRALQLLRAAPDRDQQAAALMNLAWMHRLQGQVRQAADEYQALLPMIDAQRQPYMYGAVLNNYGFCLIALGDFDKALELHTQALDLFTRLGQKSERATQLTALGTLYFRVGDAHRALDTLRSAINDFEKLGDNASLASALRLAGNAASSIAQHDLALEYLRRSAAINSNPLAVSRTRVLIAGELRQIGDLAGAEAELADSLASANQMVQADALMERARLRMAQRRSVDALADARQADALYLNLGLEFSRIDTTATMAQLLLAGKELGAAARAADEAVGIVRRLRVNSANPEWRARFLSAKYAPFEARIAVDLASPETAESPPAWRAFRTADEVRAGSLAEQLSGGDRAVEDAELTRLRDTLNSLQLRLESRLQSAAPDPEITDQIRRDIAESRARLDEYRARQESGLERTLRLPASLRAVQRQLPANTLVLAYFVGDSASHAWLLGRDVLRHTALPPRQRLQREIEATLEQPAEPRAAQQARLRLGKTLLGGLLTGVTEQRMLIIPDGPLNAVSFAALPVHGNTDRMLVDQFLIGYAPSLALALAQPQRSDAKPTRVAVISDPVYAPDDQRLPAMGASGNWRGTRPTPPNRFTRLPYSSLEAKAIRNTFGQRDTISLTGFEATRQRVLALAREDLSVLHFATHAVAREDAPERSALYLSQYSADGSLHEESQLSTADIMGSGLRARVVVLSGCATGDGDTLRGEGVLGLTYGFLANGSGAVVASLRPVEDASTARLMNEFYKAYGAHGNAAEALRSAQLSMRGRKSADSAWSSFVVRANGFP